MDDFPSPGPSSASKGGNSRPVQLGQIRTHSATSVFTPGHKQKASVSTASIDEPRFDLQHYRAWARRQKNKARFNVWARLDNAFNAWYQKWIIETLLRQ